MKKLLTYLLLTVGFVFLVGCQEDPSGQRNTMIRFTASARPETKTVYGAYYSGNNDNSNPSWQSIDWVNGDKIRIYSDYAVRRVGLESGLSEPNLYHWADYSVTGASVGTSPEVLSKAYLENLIDDGNGMGNGLYWGEALSAHFFAIYPSPGTEESAGTSINGVIGDLEGTIPPDQKPKDGKPDMSYAYMTAAGSGNKPIVDNVSNVILSFEPAFTAFEISLKSDSQDPVTLTKFELISENSPLTGTFVVSYDQDLQKSVAFTGALPGKKITYTFPENTTISSETTQTFTVFALPTSPSVSLTGLTIRFTLGNNETRSLPLKSNNSYVNFAGGKKHRILGVIMPKSLGNFKVITLDPVAGGWIDVDIDADTDNVQEATQFVVNGAKNGRKSISADYDVYPEGRDNKEYRQYWLFKEDGTVTVTFKIMAPEGGTWSIEKAGNDANKFTVTIPNGQGGTTETLTGSIAPKAAANVPATPTVVTLTIKRNSTVHTTGSEAVLYLKTYVTDKNGVKYNIDSETQLLDMRGYHYFVLNNQNTVQ